MTNFDPIHSLKISRYSRQTVMTTQDFTTTQTAPSQISWIQQLRKKIAAPIDNAPTAEQTGQQSTLPGSTLTSEAKVNTRRSELAPPPTIIEIQTLKAFSDRADEYEPPISPNRPYSRRSSVTQHLARSACCPKRKGCQNSLKEKTLPRPISFLIEPFQAEATALRPVKTAEEISDHCCTNVEYHQFCSAPSPDVLRLDPLRNLNKLQDRSLLPSAR